MSFESKTLPKNLAVLRYGWGLKLTDNSKITNVTETALQVLSTTFLALAAILALPLCLQVANGTIESIQEFLQYGLVIFTMSACGYLLRHYGLSGVRKQIQVDCSRREIRIGYLGTDNQYRLHSRIKQSDIQSAFLFRSGNPSKAARLVVRLVSRKAPLSIMSGDERELSVVLRAMIEMEHRTGSRRVRQRTTERLFQASFGRTY